MAISTYNTLVDSIIAWSHRNDLDLLIPNFISLAETEFYANPEEPLEIRPIEKTATATAVGLPIGSGSRFVALPTDFISQRDFRIEINGVEGFRLNYEVPSALIIRDQTGTPCRYTITDQIELDIVPDTDYTLTLKYFAKVTPLTVSNQTNEILTSDPNIYLYGALHQLFTYSEDDNESIKYFNKFIGAIKGANKRAKKGRYSQTRAKLRRATP